MGAVWSFPPGTLALRQGDITTADVDAVVNAANSGLGGGGGVDGAIHRAAGPELLQACKKIVSRQGRLPAGQAVITPGFNMPASFVIHTVGPIWNGGRSNEAATLRSAYEQCLLLAQENDAQDIAFPAISCGVYGYPVEQAAGIALQALREGLEAGRVRSAAMYLFSDSALETWRQTAAQLFGAPE